MLVSEYLEKHPETRYPVMDWLRNENIETMSDAWEKCEYSHWLLWVIEKENMLTKKQRVDICCRIVRTVWHLLTDDRSKNAIEVGERYVNGEATEEELNTAVADAAAVDVFFADAAAADDVFFASVVARMDQYRKQCKIIREMFGNPFKKRIEEMKNELE